MRDAVARTGVDIENAAAVSGIGLGAGASAANTLSTTEDERTGAIAAKKTKTLCFIDVSIFLEWILRQIRRCLLTGDQLYI